jgi:hypothetical protein
LAVSSWKGPSAAQQDYQLPGCAIEVKTTGTKQPQRLTINSERQLDDTGISALFLFYLSVDSREGSGESLNMLVDAIRAALVSDFAARVMFDDRLIEAGYLDLHRPLYDKTGYTVRTAKAFRVNEGFPRIVEADLKVGVGDVHYSIAVTSCMPFAVSDDFLQPFLIGQPHEQ